MKFALWIKRETGLSLYDFRVLDMDGTSEKEVRDLFNQWLEDISPTTASVTTAIEDAADEGFDVFIA